MVKGDIILITFLFTDLSGSKRRPAVVLAKSGNDVTVCFITTQLRWQDPVDFLLSPSNLNGLKKSSLIRTGKIATLDTILVKGRLGQLNNIEIANLDKNLKVHLNLS